MRLKWECGEPPHLVEPSIRGSGVGGQAQADEALRRYELDRIGNVRVWLNVVASRRCGLISCVLMKLKKGTTPGARRHAGRQADRQAGKRGETRQKETRLLERRRLEWSF